MPSRSRSFQSAAKNPVRLHAREWGRSGQPCLIALHGGGANAYWWEHLAEALATRLHVLALDFRGHGESEHPEALDPDAFGEDLRAVIRESGRERVLLMGHSMGGRVALRHAARHADVAALVLVDVPTRVASRARRRARLALARRQTYRTREEAISRFRFLPPARHVAPELRDAIAEHSVRAEPNGRFGYKFDPRWFAGPPRPEPSRSPAPPSCPTLFVRGGNSELVSREQAEAFVAGLAQGQLVEIADAGHHVHLDQPDAFLAAVRRFLEAHAES